jgi:hypothetical protein
MIVARQPRMSSNVSAIEGVLGLTTLDRFVAIGGASRALRRQSNNNVTAA